MKHLERNCTTSCTYTYEFYCNINGNYQKVLINVKTVFVKCITLWLHNKKIHINHKILRPCNILSLFFTLHVIKKTPCFSCNFWIWRSKKKSIHLVLRQNIKQVKSQSIYEYVLQTGVDKSHILLLNYSEKLNRYSKFSCYLFHSSIY